LRNGIPNRLTPSDLPAAKWRKFEILLARGSISDEDAPFLADLLSLPGSERRPIPDLSPRLKKERTLEALLRRLKTLSDRRGVVVIFEDVHWIDPTSRELLDLAIEYVRTLPVLLIVTSRPEFQPSWIGEPHVTTLVLDRLGGRDTTALAKQIAGDRALPDHLVAQIVERTDGVPLFIEELTKSILESGLLREDGDDHHVLEGHLPSFAIPTSLRALLLARLDRLGSARNVAQIGATFGRWFRYTSLYVASGLSEDELQLSLGQLVAAELLVQSGVPPDAVYTFKHALVQEAAYESVLRNRRQQLHGRVAEALEANFPELMDSQPEFFARHYTEARVVEKSVLYWSKAARRSTARSAMTEAAVQFQRALDQLALLPDSPDRQREELEICSALATVLQSIKGYAAPETGRALGRARVLWAQLGSPSAFLQVSYAQSLYHEIRGELSSAHSLDKDLLSLSRQRNDVAGLVLAHHSLGRNLMFAGRFTSSRSHFEHALALCDEISNQSLVRQAGVHPRVASQAFLAISLFCLGYPVQALARASAAIAEARKLSHPPSLAVSLTNGARLAFLLAMMPCSGSGPSNWLRSQSSGVLDCGGR
jgi:predicted ATPase